MGAIRHVVFCAILLVPARAVFPGYFGYPAAPTPYFPNLIPQQYQANPLFAYSVYTAPGPAFASVPAQMANPIYTTPDDTFRGYSFQTEYEGGGKSEVVFVTGPQANQLLQKSVELLRTIVPPEAGEITGRSANSNATKTNTTTTPQPSSPLPTAAAGPVASYYHVQLYPSHTSPFIGSPPPLQNLISSFAYSITNDVANSLKEASENTAEAQESMIHETGAVATSEAPVTSAEGTTKVTTKAPQTTAQPRSEEAPTTIVTTTAATTTNANPVTSPEPSTSSQTSGVETNTVSDANPTTAASDEIMETTSA